MGYKQVTKKTEQSKKAVSSRRTLGNAAKALHSSKPKTSRKAAPSDDEKRRKVLEERFHPKSIEFLKRNFDIDLSSKQVPLAVLYDIADGRVTSEPIEAIVCPVVYDRHDKTNVEARPVRVVASFKFGFPFERKGNSKVLLEPSEERPVFVASYPCYDFLEKADPSEMQETPAVAEQAPAQEKPAMPVFSPEQIMALEGLGITEDRLYVSSFNAVSLEDKLAMAEGRSFPVNGTVRAIDEETGVKFAVNLNGTAKMVQGKDGRILTQFEPQYPVKQRQNQVVDLLTVRKVGSLELDFFERDNKGHAKKDIYGNLVINQAGKDLVKYGVAFKPVDGFIHKRVYDKSARTFSDKIESGKYQVTLVNGGICATAMKKVFDLDKDGNQIMTVSRTGENVPKYHYECKDAIVSSDDTVRVNGQELEPLTPADLIAYKRGQGGAFKGYEYTDTKTGQKVIYDVFAYPDNQRSGYAKGFSPAVSEALIKRQHETKETASKKQNFSLGI